MLRGSSSLAAAAAAALDPSAAASEFELLGSTETVRGDPNPSWVTAFRLPAAAVLGEPGGGGGDDYRLVIRRVVGEYDDGPSCAGGGGSAAAGGRRGGGGGNSGAGGRPRGGGSPATGGRSHSWLASLLPGGRRRLTVSIVSWADVSLADAARRRDGCVERQLVDVAVGVPTPSSGVLVVCTEAFVRRRVPHALRMRLAVDMACDMHGGGGGDGGAGRRRNRPSSARKGGSGGSVARSRGGRGDDDGPGLSLLYVVYKDLLGSTQGEFLPVFRSPPVELPPPCRRRPRPSASASEAGVSLDDDSVGATTVAAGGPGGTGGPRRSSTAVPAFELEPVLLDVDGLVGDVPGRALRLELFLSRPSPGAGGGVSPIGYVLTSMGALAYARRGSRLAVEPSPGSALLGGQLVVDDVRVARPGGSNGDAGGARGLDSALPLGDAKPLVSRVKLRAVHFRWSSGGGGWAAAVAAAAADAPVVVDTYGRGGFTEGVDPLPSRPGGVGLSRGVSYISPTRVASSKAVAATASREGRGGDAPPLPYAGAADGLAS
ncbi:hypothetical protein I4F81_012242 [Pyropia yezoensis]|uniref:Uncharacterized protein n=1 Tax=Pyropia yezoensis TaxID=2788 RepID=A0ACC3CHM6_PYRYE|nr:hypothetical protein I4F81_012242 [Neopyropia yezoensis]